MRQKKVCACVYMRVSEHVDACGFSSILALLGTHNV